MPNGTYGGVRGEETKVGQKTFVSRPTRFHVGKKKFFGSFISFLRSFISRPRGEFFIFHVDVSNFLRRNWLKRKIYEIAVEWGKCADIKADTLDTMNSSTSLFFICRSFVAPARAIMMRQP